ncbi:MAG: N-acetylmuramoyl-L-alanine amidase, partial [Deltaproteobacteria bacterium]|nr:N-acetylmuramoyl-L-alanine amidase [Deltaproteobacteria bacterium]
SLVTSQRPRAEESSRYAAQFNGAPPSVYDQDGNRDDRNDDVSTRSRFTAWAHEEGEDAVFVAWHTNASSSGGRGTEVFAFGPGYVNGAYQFTGVAGSKELADKVYGELVADIKAAWDPAWKTRGVKSAEFGELRPTHNGETPAILMEMAFHDQVDDARQLKDPRFRYLLTRSVMQGIIKYFAARDTACTASSDCVAGTCQNGTCTDAKPAELPPEPPAALVARNLGESKVQVQWLPPTLDPAAGAPAASWLLYQGRDGLSWDDGTPATGTSLTVQLQPGELRYFRVSGVNAGGESFPSQAVGAVATAGAAPVLVVNGFERLDATLGRFDDLSAWSLGNVFRVALLRMNDGSYVRHHGDAVAAAGRAFDSATVAALAGGLVAPVGYSLVDWLAGRGQDTGAPTQEQLSALKGFVEAGGRLLVSGSSLAGALAAGSPEAQAFLSQVLGAQVTAATGTPPISGSPGGLLDGVAGLLLDDGLGGTYPAGAPDGLSTAGAEVLAVDATGNPAALRKGNAVLLGFPLETVTDAAKRAEVLSRLLDWAAVPEVEHGGWDGGTPGGEDAATPGPVTLPALAGDVASGPKVGGCGCAASGAPPLGFCALWLAFARKTAGRRRR